MCSLYVTFYPHCFSQRKKRKLLVTFNWTFAPPLKPNFKCSLTAHIHVISTNCFFIFPLKGGQFFSQKFAMMTS